MSKPDIRSGFPTTSGVTNTGRWFPFRPLYEACRIAAADAVGRRIVHGTLVQVLHAVLLGLPGGGQLGHDHAQQGVRGIDPDLHGSLHQGLASQRLLVALQHDTQGAHHLLVLLLMGNDDGDTTERDSHRLAPYTGRSGVSQWLATLAIPQPRRTEGVALSSFMMARIS